MRLFIAVKFPENISAALRDVQTELKKQGLKGNYSGIENLHLTLAFLGEVASADAVKDVMDNVSFTSFSLSLKEGGRFKDLYWAGMEENAGLSAYVKKLRSALSAEGIWFDPKPFKPHITLVRRGNAQGSVRVNVPEEKFEASKVSLMLSERIDGKLVYTEIYSVNAS